VIDCETMTVVEGLTLTLTTLVLPLPPHPATTTRANVVRPHNTAV
jgi:hypothetical protein